MSRIKEKRCAFFIPSFNGGGAEKVIVEVANNLAARGYDVDIIALEAKGPYLERLSEQVRLVDLNVQSMRHSLVSLRRYFRATKPSCVLSTGLHTSIALLIASVLAGSSARLVVREALPLNIEMRQYRLLSVLTKLLYWRFDAFIALTACQQRLRHSAVFIRKKSEEFVIPNPLDIEHLTQMANRPTQPELPETYMGSKIIVACGRLTEQKNFHMLIDAFFKVRQDRECRLIILGEGELRESLWEKVQALGLQNDIWMPGFVENPHAFVSRAAVFVLSSWYEGMPNSLLHANAIGTPCVATRCDCGPEEIFQYSGSGVLVKVGDVNEMANALSTQLSVKAKDDVTDSNWVEAMSLQNVSTAYAEAIGLVASSEAV